MLYKIENKFKEKLLLICINKNCSDYSTFVVFHGSDNLLFDIAFKLANHDIQIYNYYLYKKSSYLPFIKGNLNIIAIHNRF